MTALATAGPDLRDLPTTEDLVLAARPLRPGITLAATSRFGEDLWRLEPAVLQRHVASLTLRFTTVPARYRLHAKQLCYAMLSGPLPAGEKRHSPVGVHGALAGLRRFLRWLDTRPATPGRLAGPALAELTPRDLDDYNRHLLTIRHIGTRQHAQRAVRLLWRYRRGLSDPIPMDPHHADGWVGAHRPRENTTDRIPEPVLAAVIGWAVRFVDQFSPDILAANAWTQDFRSRQSNGLRGRTTGARDDLQSYLDSHVQSGRPLPGVGGKPNTRFISVAAGLNATSVNTRPELRALIRVAAIQVGATEHTWLPTPILGVLDGQPWITGIAQQHPTQSLNMLRRMLHGDRVPVRHARRRGQAPPPRLPNHPARPRRPALPVETGQPHLQGRERPRRNRRHLDRGASRRPGR